MKNGIFAVLAVIGSWIANKCGGWDVAMKVLVGLMIADYVTGLLVAFVFKNSPKTADGKASSHESFLGLFRKMMILVFVWLGAQLDAVTGGVYIRSAIIIFYIGNEGLSIIENGGLMGVPYPPFMKNALEALKDKGGGGGTDDSSDDEATDEYPTL
ncbi:MAG: holin [Clostridia bacterium]|nr:holin [Clostridia bacterium]